MKRFFTILTLSIVSIFHSIQAQDIVNFEDFGLEPDEFLNGSDGTTEFNSLDLITLPISFNEDFGSWTGWSISSMTDNETPGFTNQYSAITGGGVDGSNTYATSFNFVPNTMELAESIFPNSQKQLIGMYITNATYTYLSMRDGDAFAKKFGGVDGNDPDFLLLTIKGLNLEMEQDSVEFYLADYRFEDNSEDYLVDEWTFIDLSNFGTGQTLSFQLTSSDVGVYGVNTPQYFCIDNIEFDITSSVEDESFADLNVYPNPASEYLNIDFQQEATYSISSIDGRFIVVNQPLTPQVDINFLKSGLYNVHITTNKGTVSRKIVKL